MPSARNPLAITGTTMDTRMNTPRRSGERYISSAVKASEGDCGYQEAQSGAGLRDIKRAFRDFDRIGVGVVCDAEQIQAVRGERRGDVLQLRGDEGAERDQEEQVEQRPQQGAIQAPAEHREEQQLDHAHGHELASLHDPDPISQEPGDRHRQHGQRGDRQRARHRAHQYGAAIPDQVGDDRDHQKTMVVRRGVHPDRDRCGDLGVKHQPEHQAAPRPAPAAPTAARFGAP